MRRPNRRPTYLKTEDIENYEIPPDYLVYKDGEVTIAVNGDTGEEDSRNTDSFTVIQYAVNNGNHVHIKGGTYTMTDQLVLNDNNVVSGSGPETILKLDAMTNTNIFYATGKSNITIKDLALDGNKAAQNAAWGHKVGGDESKNNNIYFVGCSNCQILHITTYNSTNNLILLYNGCTECLTDGCIAYGADWHGIEYWMDVANSTICNCIARDCYVQPIVVELGTTHDCSIVNNIVSDDGSATASADGILVQSCTKALVANNTCEEVRIRIVNTTFSDIIGNRATIQNIELAVDSDNNNIVGNYLYDQAGHGISISSDKNNIVGNYIYSTGANAIYLAGDSDKNNVVGNYIIDSVNGIIEDGTGNYNNISDNYFENTSPEVTIVGANTIVRHNYGYVTENSGTATMLNAGSSIVVAHGLAATPTVINVTGQHAEVLDLHVGTIGAANFTITTVGAVSADRAIFWEAKVR